MMLIMIFEQYGLPKERHNTWYDFDTGFWSFPTNLIDERGYPDAVVLIMSTFPHVTQRVKGEVERMCVRERMHMWWLVYSNITRCEKHKRPTAAASLPCL